MLYAAFITSGAGSAYSSAAFITSGVIDLSAPLNNMSVISWHAVLLVNELRENHATTESH
jgi:hypothetical protein